MRIEVSMIVAVIFLKRPLKKQMAGGQHLIVMWCQIFFEVSEISRSFLETFLRNDFLNISNNFMPGQPHDGIYEPRQLSTRANFSSVHIMYILKKDVLNFSWSEYRTKE